MKRFLATVLLLLVTACAPVSTPAPTVTAWATPTIPPTQPPPDYTLRPACKAVGSINVLGCHCYATTTVIAVYPWGMQWFYDDAARAACVEAKRL